MSDEDEKTEDETELDDEEQSSREKPKRPSPGMIDVATDLLDDIDDS